MARLAQAPDVPAHVEVVFDGGMPVAVNGIEMSLAELTESLATIAGDHGFLSAASVAGAAPLPLGVSVVACARQALEAVPERAESGVVCLRLHDGEHTVLSVRPASLVVSA